MPNSTNDPAWPSLLTPGTDWTVKLSTQDGARVGTLRDTRTDVVIGHTLEVPRLQLPTDYLIHQHELRHVLRNQRRGREFERTGHKQRDAFRKMIEECATEIENSAVGVDTRGCRDNLDWSGLHVRDAKDAALWYLQLVHTCTPDVFEQRPPELRRFYAEILDMLPEERHKELDDLYHALRRCFRSEVDLNEAADWITSKYVAAEDPPETITDDPAVCGYPGSDGGKYGDFESESETATGRDYETEAEAGIGDEESDDDGSEPDIEDLTLSRQETMPELEANMARQVYLVRKLRTLTVMLERRRQAQLLGLSQIVSVAPAPTG